MDIEPLPSDSFSEPVPTQRPLWPALVLLAVVLAVLAFGAWWFLPKTSSPEPDFDEELFPSTDVSKSVSASAAPVQPEKIQYDVIVRSDAVSLSGTSITPARRVLQTDAGRQETFVLRNAGSTDAVLTGYYVIPKSLAAHASDVSRTHAGQVVLDDPILRIVYRIKAGGRETELIEPHGSGTRSCILNLLLSGTPQLPPVALQALADLPVLECVDEASCGRCNRVSTELSSLVNSKSAGSAAELQAALDAYRDGLIRSLPSPSATPAAALDRPAASVTPSGGVPSSAVPSSALLFLSELSPSIEVPIEVTSSWNNPSAGSSTIPVELLVRLNQGSLVGSEGQALAGDGVFSLGSKAVLRGNTWVQPVSVGLNRLRTSSDIFRLGSGSASLTYQFGEQYSNGRKPPSVLPMSFIVEHVRLADYVWAYPSDLTPGSDADKPLYVVNNLQIIIQLDGCGVSQVLPPGGHATVMVKKDDAIRRDQGCQLRLAGSDYSIPIRWLSPSKKRLAGDARDVADLSAPTASDVSSPHSCADGYCTCGQLTSAWQFARSDFEGFQRTMALYPAASDARAVQKTYLLRNAEARDCAAGMGSSVLVPARSTSWLTLSATRTESGVSSVQAQIVLETQADSYAEAASSAKSSGGAKASGTFDALVSDYRAGTFSAAYEQAVQDVPDGVFDDEYAEAGIS